MKINIFEGARRIALVSAVGASLIAIGFIWNNEPSKQMTFEVTKPGATPTRTAKECGPNDQSDVDTGKTKAHQRSYWRTICFRAVGSGGKYGIPYAIVEGGSRWSVNDKYSSEVSTYIATMSTAFDLTEADEIEVESGYWMARLKAAGESLGYLAIGLACWGLLVWIVGWIVRGFLGIKPGRDFRDA